MRAIVLLRVSTDAQAEAGNGLNAQRDACHAYADRHGLEVVGPFLDDGVSGAAPLEKRPGLMAAMEEIAAGDVLLVAKRDRLGRDPLIVATLEAAVKKRRARIVSAAGEGTDGEAPSDELMRMIVDAFATYERLLIRSRTKSALTAKRRRNERTGGVPLGYDLADDGRTSRAGLPLALIPNAGELAIVAEIRGLAASGLRPRAIAKELTRRGIPTKTGKATWSHGAVQRILARPGQSAA